MEDSGCCRKPDMKWIQFMNLNNILRSDQCIKWCHMAYAPHIILHLPVVDIYFTKMVELDITTLIIIGALAPAFTEPEHQYR